MSTVEQRKLIESFLVKDLYPDDELSRIAEKLGPKHVAILAVMTMSVALDRKFPAKPGRAEISEYAGYLAKNYGSDEMSVQPLVVEALVRANLGESGLLAGLAPEVTVPHETLIAYDIFTGLGLDEAGFNAFVDEALESASDYHAG